MFPTSLSFLFHFLPCISPRSLSPGGCAAETHTRAGRRRDKGRRMAREQWHRALADHAGRNGEQVRRISVQMRRTVPPSRCLQPAAPSSAVRNPRCMHCAAWSNMLRQGATKDPQLITGHARCRVLGVLSLGPCIACRKQPGATHTEGQELEGCFRSRHLLERKGKEPTDNVWCTWEALASCMWHLSILMLPLDDVRLESWHTDLLRVCMTQGPGRGMTKCIMQAKLRHNEVVSNRVVQARHLGRVWGWPRPMSRGSRPPIARAHWARGD